MKARFRYWNWHGSFVFYWRAIRHMLTLDYYKICPFVWLERINFTKHWSFVFNRIIKFLLISFKSIMLGRFFEPKRYVAFSRALLKIVCLRGQISDCLLLSSFRAVRWWSSIFPDLLNDFSTDSYSRFQSRSEHSFVRMSAGWSTVGNAYSWKHKVNDCTRVKQTRVNFDDQKVNLNELQIAEPIVFVFFKLVLP